MLGSIPLVHSGRTAPAIRRTELVVIAILLSAVAAFIWNGSELLQLVAEGRAPEFSTEVQVAAAALVLNVALILFGWRRYVDLQHERELRVHGEQRAALQAATDSITGLANRKGFADGIDRLCRERLSPQHSLVIVSLQIQRFKRINDRHGYDTGDALLREMAAAMRGDVPEGAVIARLSGTSSPSPSASPLATSLPLRSWRRHC
jgi:predicted signal transduction protein with EAL and GGDEF domain